MSGGGLRFDTGKSNLAALDNAFLRAVAETQTYGAMKYTPNNWRKGMAWSKVYSPLMRHCWKFWAGLENDTESHVHHFGHIGCNLAYLFEYERCGVGNDDLMVQPTPNPEATADKIPPVAHKDYQPLTPVRFDLVPAAWVYALGFANNYLPRENNIGITFSRMMNNILLWKFVHTRVDDSGYSRILLAAVDAMRLYEDCMFGFQHEMDEARGLEFQEPITDESLENCCKGIIA